MCFLEKMQLAPVETLKQNPHFEKRSPTSSRCGGQSREPPIRPEDAHRKNKVFYNAAFALWRDWWPPCCPLQSWSTLPWRSGLRSQHDVTQTGHGVSLPGYIAVWTPDPVWTSPNWVQTIVVGASWFKLVQVYSSQSTWLQTGLS